MRRPAFVTLLFAVAFVASACKPTDPGGFVVVTQGPASPDPSITGAAVPGSSAAVGSIFPVIISSQLAVGDNRFVFSFLDPKTQQPVGSPDLAASVSFIAPGTTDTTPPVPGTFVWAIQNLRGEYISHVTFPSAGDWKAVFIVQPKGGSQQALGVPFQVLPKPTVVSIGDHAPDLKTPILADVGGDIRRISSDQNPDPAFYQVSVDQAIARHTPFILVFATPAFCRSAQCGPTLDMVKQARTSAPASVAFINVEPYVLTYTDGRLQPVLDAQGNLTPTDVSNAWGLPTEPWIFAVDRNGIVQGSFEGVISQQELTDIIAKIAAS
jgi:hypothetical protein